MKLPLSKPLNLYWENLRIFIKIKRALLREFIKERIAIRQHRIRVLAVSQNMTVCKQF